MQCAIYNPTVTRTVVVDPYHDASGLTSCSDSTLAFFGGFWWYMFAGVTTGTPEGAGQLIWCKKAATIAGLAAATAFQPFNDATYATNPIVASTVQWQPNLTVIAGALCCSWVGGNLFWSRLTAAAGKWTNHRVEFVGATTVALNPNPEGSVLGGYAVTPTVNDLSDYLPFATQNPVQLANGVWMIPLVLESSTLSSLGASYTTFQRVIKYPAFLRTEDGLTFTLSGTVSGGTFGDYASWEPFIVQDVDGTVWAYVRNLVPGDDRDGLLVAKSSDGGLTFAAATSTKLTVPSTRGFARRLSTSRWAMIHCDFPQHARTPAKTVTLEGRQNGAVFFSRTGKNDWIPGVTFAGNLGDIDYPQFAVDTDGTLHVDFTRGHTGGIANRRWAEVASLTAPDATAALISPRNYGRLAMRHAPVLVTGPPAYYDCDDATSLTSTTSTTGATALTFSGWLERNDNADVIIDTRPVAGSTTNPGQAWTGWGISVGRLNLIHSFAQTFHAPIFLAAVLAPAAETITMYYGDGSASSLSTTVVNTRTVLFGGSAVADGDTLTIDGTTFTFRTSATLTNDVQISGVAATITNLIAKLAAHSLDYAQVGNRLILIRTDYATFAVSKSSTQITIDTTYPYGGNVALVGRQNDSSSLGPFRGRIYKAQIYTSALSTSNLDYLYNAKAAGFGFAALTDAGTDPGAGAIVLDPTSPDTTQFPGLAVTDLHYCQVVDANTLRTHGRGSAGVELPYDVTDVVIRYKLGAAPSGTDRYVLATFGTQFDFPASLYIDGAHPTKVYCNSRYVADVADPAVWSAITVRVWTNKMTVGAFEMAFAGPPRMYLGDAWPTGNFLDASKTVDFDVSSMTATKVA